MNHMIEEVLVADDHGVVRMGLSLMIKRLRPGVVIDEVDDYQKVMQIIKEKTFDLAILDLNMPNGNFNEALQAIKLKSSETKVMIFSSQDEALYAVRYLKMGADGFLHKDSTEGAINKALIKMLDQGRYISDNVKESLIQDKLNNRKTSKNPLDLLSDREMGIAERLIAGGPMKEISFELNIHPTTVSTYKARIFEKLNIQTIPELIKIFDFYQITKL